MKNESKAWLGAWILTLILGLFIYWSLCAAFKLPQIKEVSLNLSGKPVMMNTTDFSSFFSNMHLFCESSELPCYTILSTNLGVAQIHIGRGILVKGKGNEQRQLIAYLIAGSSTNRQITTLDIMDSDDYRQASFSLPSGLSSPALLLVSFQSDMGAGPFEMTQRILSPSKLNGVLKEKRQVLSILAWSGAGDPSPSLVSSNKNSTFNREGSQTNPPPILETEPEITPTPVQPESQTAVPPREPPPEEILPQKMEGPLPEVAMELAHGPVDFKAIMINDFKRLAVQYNFALVAQKNGNTNRIVYYPLGMGKEEVKRLKMSLTEVRSRFSPLGIAVSSFSSDVQDYFFDTLLEPVDWALRNQCQFDVYCGDMIWDAVKKARAEKLNIGKQDKIRAVFKFVTVSGGFGLELESVVQDNKTSASTTQSGSK